MSTFEQARDGVRVAATWTYDGTWSSLTTLGLETEDREGLCAFEHLWVSNLVGELLMLGLLLQPSSASSLASVRVRIAGFQGAASFESSRGRTSHSNLPSVTDSTYERTGVFETTVLATDPRDAVRELLGPLLVSFVQRDTVALVSKA